MPPETCPNCGANVPPHARACPGCGADEKTGWSESAGAGRLGIPDDNFDYDEFLKEEFGGNDVKPRGIRWIWWTTALVLVLLFLSFFFRFWVR